MSLFRSLQTRYEQELELQAYSNRPWPATYREPMPEINLNSYTLQIRIENQLPKTIGLKQLASLPTFTEIRSIYSKAGWTYQGSWKGVTFQTLLSLFSTPHLYPWVRLESVTDKVYVIERRALLSYRIAMECDGQPLSVAYGGPLWAHCFDHYIEYSIPYLKSITLLQGEHSPCHPAETIGFRLDQAQVESGDYYAIHQEQIVRFESR